MHALLAATKMKSSPARSALPVINLLMAVILGTGLLLIWIVGFMLLLGIGGMYFESPTWPQLEFTTQGEPVLKSYIDRELGQADYHNLNGERVAAPINTLRGSNHLAADSRQQTAERQLDWEWRIHGYSLESRHSFWYLIHDGRPKGNAYFAGYDAASKRPIGYIGKKGFRSAKPSGDELFPMQLERFNHMGLVPYSGAHEPRSYWDRTDDNVFLISGTDLLCVNLESQSVSTVPLPSPPLVLGISQILRSTDSDALSTYVVARLPKELVVVPFSGKDQFTIPLPGEVQDQYLDLYWPSKHMTDQVILVSGQDSIHAPKKMFWIDKQGAIKRREEWIPEPAPPESWTTPFLLAIGLPMPAPYTCFSILAPGGTIEPDWHKLTYQEKVARRVVVFGPALLLLTLVSLALAIVAFRRERAQGRGFAMSWFFLVLLFGWPAFVGYWLTVQHPAWMCGESAPSSEPSALPALSGIEIFA